MGNSIVPDYTIDPNAYANPVGNQAGNWQNAMQGMLGATTGKAPQAGNTQLGAAQTYGGANIGPTATYGGADINAGQYNNTFGQEQGLANQLGQQAQGFGPSVAQVTAQQQGQANLANQMAMLGSQRGSSNPALAQQAALQAGAQANQQAAQQAVLGRTQEELGAEQAQGSLLGNMNSQASGFATNQAQLQQQAGLASMGAVNSGNQAQAQLYQQAGMGNQSAANQFGLQQGQMNQQSTLANLQAALQSGQLNAQQYNTYLQALTGENAQQMQANQAQQSLGVQQQLGLGQINAGIAAQQAQQNMQVAGAAMSGLSGLMAFL